MSRVSQNIYFPLPQSISDSESEKEIYVEHVCSPYKNKGRVNGEFSSLRTQNCHPRTAGVIQDVLKVENELPRFSSLRKYAFIFSIIFCFLPAALFLWMLPCPEMSSCRSIELNWKNKLSSIELKGAINLIPSVFTDNLNLAVLYKGNQYIYGDLNHGIVSFLGSNGNIAWNFRQDIVPEYLDCSLIDVNGNGLKDCLLLDERGLKVLGTMSGEIIWHVHSNEEGKTIVDLEFPIIIPDLNHDGINELMMVYKHEHLLVVCGKTGRALRSIQASCQKIETLRLDDSQNIIFSCQSASVVYRSSLHDLLRRYDSKLNFEFTKVNESTTQDRPVKNSRRRITADIVGNYPNISTKVTMYDEILNNNIHTWKLDNGFVSKPKEFSLQLPYTSPSFPKGYVSGFIFKMWKWPASGPQDDFVSISNETYVVNKISEEIVLIAYNYTNSFNTFNVSFTEIVQLCSVKDTLCQPDLENLHESLLLDDLNQDQVPELITFSSSFIHEKREIQQRSWQLVSTVSVMNLELELQKVLSLD